MTLNVTPIGDNPQIPGILAQTYVPDQLIAGNLKLVTDTVLITGGAALLRGSVLGQVLTGTVGPAAAGANTGNGTVTAITTGAKTKVGAYTVKLKSATTFDVLDPNGAQIAEGLALGAYQDAQLNFTITAGATAFVAGDSFSIPVTGSMSYKLAVGTATDGSQVPVAILAGNTDASQSDVLGGIYQMGEFNGNALIIDPSLTLASVKAQLLTRGIIIKTNVVSAADPS